MSKKKVLFVTTVPNTIKSFLLPYVEELRKRGCVVHAMARDISRETELSEIFDKVWEVKFDRNPVKALLKINLINNIEKIIESEAYSFLHLHTPVASFIVRMAVKNIPSELRPKIIYTAHGLHTHPLGNKLLNEGFVILERYVGKYTDSLVVINQYDYNIALKRNLAAIDSIHYIQGIGIDSNRYSAVNVAMADVNALKSTLRIPSDSYLFAMIGEFNPGKRHIDVVKALSVLDNKKIHVIFAGVGKEMDKIKRETKKRSLDANVHFLGRRDDIPQILSSCIGLVHPSIREGLPRVVMEAMSMEVPVVGANVRGTKELLSCGCGILVPPRDYKKLAAAIKWIIENREKRAIMGKLGRNAILEKYDIKVILPKYLKIYADALAE